MILWLLKALLLIKAMAVLGFFCFASSLLANNTWIALGSAGVGERYFFYLGLTFFVLRLHFEHDLFALRGALVLSRNLAVTAFGMLQNWVYDPPFHALDFAPQIAKYDQSTRSRSPLRFPLTERYTRPTEQLRWLRSELVCKQSVCTLHSMEL